MNKKIVSAVFLIIIGVAVIYSGYVLFGSSIYNYYEGWKIGRAYHKFEQGFTDYLKSDTYGGATPEETYKLFVETLKSGDIESASKYFYWEHQVPEQKKLQKMKDEGKLEEYINGLPDWGQMKEEEYWDKDGKMFSWIEVSEEPVSVRLPLGGDRYQEEILEPGEYKQEITFWSNQRANIWKIYSL